MEPEKVLENRCIMVVEDEYLIATEIAETIREAGGMVLGPYPDAVVACKALAQFDKIPGAALLDLNLRGKTADELAWELKRQRIPILYYTGYETIDPMQKLPDGAYLRKPQTRRMLQQNLAETLKSYGTQS